MKKKVGIIESLKQAKTVKEVNELSKKLETYDQVSIKTVRKFAKISRRKRTKFRSSNK
tara:strand:+ start:205 stop:378 length:174 start_codon:yes stop_codon:yes gene_type:complete